MRHKTTTERQTTPTETDSNYRDRQTATTETHLQHVINCRERVTAVILLNIHGFKPGATEDRNLSDSQGFL